jgi:hypothetical protein
LRTSGLFTGVLEVKPKLSASIIEFRKNSKSVAWYSFVPGESVNDVGAQRDQLKKVSAIQGQVDNALRVDHPAHRCASEINTHDLLNLKSYAAPDH